MPRTDLTSYPNLPSHKNDTISAKPDTLQNCSFASRDGDYDQLVIRTPRKLKCHVGNNFPYKFLEKKNQNKNKFESKYETTPQTAIAGTKHTITTDTKKIVHRKLFSKPLPNSFHNPLPRRGGNARGPEGRFTQTTFLPISTSGEKEEEEVQSEITNH